MARWDFVLQLSNYDTKTRSYDAQIKCPSHLEKCVIGNHSDTHVRKFQCNEAHTECHLELNDFITVSAPSESLQIHRIYGSIDAPIMDAQTHEGQFTVNMKPR